jgi:hypothetical protein
MVKYKTIFGYNPSFKWSNQDNKKLCEKLLDKIEALESKIVQPTIEEEDLLDVEKVTQYLGLLKQYTRQYNKGFSEWCLLMHRISALRNNDEEYTREEAESYNMTREDLIKQNALLQRTILLSDKGKIN